MTYILDEIILARMMTTLDLKSKRALYYHDKGYEKHNDYGFPAWITRPISVYSIITTEASFDLADFTTAQHPISPFTPKCPRSLPFWEGICWCQTFDKMPTQMPETDSEDEKEPLPTADPDAPVWNEEPVSDSREYIYIYEIPRLATPTRHCLNVHRNLL